MSKFIWTKHAVQRNKERGISEQLINLALNSPDNIYSQDQTEKYKKKFDYQTVTVIVKKNDMGENIILSTWIDPPNYGTKDFKKRKLYKESIKAGNLKKFWLTLRSQIGI